MNSQGCAHTAAAFESKRFMAPARQPKITMLMHFRLQIRMAGGEHRGFQQQRTIQIRIAGGRQKPPIDFN